MAALACGRTTVGWVLFAMAVGTKLQSLVLAPVVMAATLLEARRQLRRARPMDNASRRAWRNAAATVLMLPWIVTGRVEEMLLAVVRFPGEPRVDVSAYNLWFLVLRGRVHDVSSEIRPWDLPFSYRQLGLLLVCGVTGGCPTDC